MARPDDAQLITIVRNEITALATQRDPDLKRTLEGLQQMMKAGGKDGEKDVLTFLNSTMNEIDRARAAAGTIAPGTKLSLKISILETEAPPLSKAANESLINRRELIKGGAFLLAGTAVLGAGIEEYFRRGKAINSLERSFSGLPEAGTKMPRPSAHRERRDDLPGNPFIDRKEVDGEVEMVPEKEEDKKKMEDIQQLRSGKNIAYWGMIVGGVVDATVIAWYGGKAGFRFLNHALSGPQAVQIGKSVNGVQKLLSKAGYDTPDINLSYHFQGQDIAVGV